MSGICLAKAPLTLSSLIRIAACRIRSGHAGRGTLSQGTPGRHPHPQADADTGSCRLAKASLRGEGWGEGGFAA